MKNGFFMALALAVWGALKLFFSFLKKAIEVLSSIILYLGLYIPLFYIVFGLILLATTSFTFGGTGTYQILYFVGLGLCCIAALVITIRNLVVRPFSSVFAAFRGKKEEDYDRRSRYDDEDDRYYADRDDRRYGDRRYADRRRRDRRDYDDEDDYYEEDRYERARPSRDRYERDRDYDREEYEDRRRRPVTRSYYEEDDEPQTSPARGERPLVYYSQRRPGVLVKEYSDRFELFTEDARGESHIGTEYKEE